MFRTRRTPLPRRRERAMGEPSIPTIGRGARAGIALVLAGMFTPIKNWLQGFVDRRFKPVAALNTGPSEDVELTVDQRVAILEQRMARIEVGSSSRDDHFD